MEAGRFIPVFSISAPTSTGSWGIAAVWLLFEGRREAWHMSIVSTVVHSLFLLLRLPPAARLTVWPVPFLCQLGSRGFIGAPPRPPSPSLMEVIVTTCGSSSEGSVSLSQGQLSASSKLLTAMGEGGGHFFLICQTNFSQRATGLAAVRVSGGNLVGRGR